MRRAKVVIMGLIVFAFGVTLFTSALAWAQPRVTLRFNLTPNVYISIPRSPSVSISVDRGEDATYYIGDPITIRYGASQAGYINIFDYTPDGGVIILVRDQRINAGASQVLNSTVTGPAGTERLVILYTPKPVGESQIQGFIESPHQSGRQFPLSAVNRTHFNVVSRTRVTNLTIQPATFTIEPGSNYTLTALLTDANGRPLRGSALAWSTDNGSLDTYNTITDNSGRSSIVYYAPSTTRPNTAVINVSFSGGGGASPSSAQSIANIASRTRSTEIIVSPSSFSAKSGDEIRFTATLRDMNGNPISGRTLYWTTDLGSFSRTSTITDSSGKATVSFYAPDVSEMTSAALTVEFRGATGLGSSSNTLSGSIEPIMPTTPTTTLFYLDFGTGTAENNFLTMRYTGNVTYGYSLSGTYSLEMLTGNTIDLTFSPGTIPEKATLLLWGQGDSGTKIRLTLNNQRLSSITTGSNIIEPDSPKIINLPMNKIIEGNNRLRIEVDVGRNQMVHIQRVIIVF